ncbi:MAG: hypothetical protein JNK68_04035 [Betaproteobacteria bacterium]|nr:hypothetical protein [Betaproteobacteria bacterium]
MSNIEPHEFTDLVRSAGDYIDWLSQALLNIRLPANNRVRAAAACLAIAQEHHHSIVLLVKHSLYASSFALVRAAFEAYVRGEWLTLCAKDAQVCEFWKGREPPRIDALLEDLEKCPPFCEQVLSGIKGRHWKVMCAYTHTGGLHVQRWNTSEAIEPAYDGQEIQEVISFVEWIGSLSALAVARLAEDEALCDRVLCEWEKRSAIPDTNRHG